MNKRPVNRGEYQTIKRELDFFEKQGLLPTLQKDEMLSQYTVNGRINFIRILLMVGAFLLGIGVLSFVSSNWMYIGKTAKFLLIIFSIIGVNIAGLKLSVNQPKTGRTMHYLGVLFFGAGIFLVEQMFNIGGEFQNALIIWALGVIPIGYLLKDRIIMVFISFLLTIYMGIVILDNTLSIPYIMLIVIPSLYWINSKMNYSRAVVFFINILSVQLIVIFMMTNFIGTDETKTFFLLKCLLIIGVAMLFLPVKDKVKIVYRLQGNLIHSTVGLIFTFPFIWEQTNSTGNFHFVFAFMYFLFVLYLIKGGSIFNIAVLCVLILRFYLDLSYDFLPKSMVFILGGLIFIGFGYYFEKQRKKGGRANEN